MEICIFRTFQIDLLRLIKNKALLCKNFNIQPSELDRMTFYEYEFYLLEVQDMIKKEQDKQDENNEKYNPSSMMRQAKSSMPKINMSTQSIPKF